jgi:hypothetical protein
MPSYFERAKQRWQSFHSWCASFPSRHIWPRLRHLGLAVKKGCPVWLTLAVIVILGCVALLFPMDVARYVVGFELSVDDRVRWLGLAYQLAGLGLVVHGLRRSRQLFNKPTYFQDFVHHLRYAFRPPPPKSFTPKGVDSISTTVAEWGRVHVAGGTLEERITRLETELQDLQNRVNKVDVSIRQTESRLNKRIDDESRSRKQGDEDNSKKIEEATIGGIHLEAIGILFLILGILLSTAPREFASMAPILCPLLCWI